MNNHDRFVLKKKINRLIQTGKLNDKKVVIFGASIMAKEIKACLLKNGLKPDVLIDNDSRKIGK